MLYHLCSIFFKGDCLFWCLLGVQKVINYDAASLTFDLIIIDTVVFVSFLVPLKVTDLVEVSSRGDTPEQTLTQPTPHGRADPEPGREYPPEKTCIISSQSSTQGELCIYFLVDRDALPQVKRSRGRVLAHWLYSRQ